MDWKTANRKPKTIKFWTPWSKLLCSKTGTTQTLVAFWTSEFACTLLKSAVKYSSKTPRCTPVFRIKPFGQGDPNLLPSIPCLPNSYPLILWLPLFLSSSPGSRNPSPRFSWAPTPCPPLSIRIAANVLFSHTWLAFPLQLSNTAEIFLAFIVFWVSQSQIYYMYWSYNFGPYETALSQ